MRFPRNNVPSTMVFGLNSQSNPVQGSWAQTGDYIDIWDEESQSYQPMIMPEGGVYYDGQLWGPSISYTRDADGNMVSTGVNLDNREWDHTRTSLGRGRDWVNTNDGTYLGGLVSANTLKDAFDLAAVGALGYGAGQAISGMVNPAPATSAAELDAIAYQPTTAYTPAEVAAGASDSAVAGASVLDDVAANAVMNPFENPETINHPGQNPKVIPGGVAKTAANNIDPRWLIGGEVVSGLINAEAASDATDAAVNAYEKGIDLQREQFDTLIDLQSPFHEAGVEALGQYQDALANPSNIPIPGQGDLNSLANFNVIDDPGYQFRLGEMERAINRNSAGMGNMLSGNRLDEIMSRVGDMASTEYGAAYNRAADRENKAYLRGVDDYNLRYGVEHDNLNRLSNLAGVGQTAASNVGNLGTQLSGNMANALAGIGESQQAGILGQAGAYGGALQNIMDYYFDRQGQQNPNRFWQQGY